MNLSPMLVSFPVLVSHSFSCAEGGSLGLDFDFEFEGEEEEESNSVHASYVLSSHFLTSASSSDSEAWECQSPPAQGEVYAGEKLPGRWAAMIVILKWDVEGEVSSEMAVLRPVTPAPRMRICF